MIDDQPSATDWICLTPNIGDLASAQTGFCRAVSTLIEAMRLDGRERVARSLKEIIDNDQCWPRTAQVPLCTALRVVADLIQQGWNFEVNGEAVRCRRSAPVSQNEERAIRRAQLALRREEQLQEESTQRFIRRMERPRITTSGRRSIFDLMCDGRLLADRLETASGVTSTAIQPYLQLVDSKAVCEFTGLPLQDIWRYFRHTWASAYDSVPGRFLQVLVRDAAIPQHPIMGVIGIGSATIRVRCRDEFIGWEPGDIVCGCKSGSPSRWARWMTRFLTNKFDEMFCQDLLRDGLIPPGGLAAMTTAIEFDLRQEASRCRSVHHAQLNRTEFTKGIDAAQLTTADWERQATTMLHRSKRCVRLAELIAIADALGMLRAGRVSADTIRKLSNDRAGRRAVSRLVREARAETVGTEIADLLVCGTVPPYNEILGGKLVAMLAMSGDMVRYYRERYSGSISVIASSLAGRAVSRSANLVFISTTSLYGLRPCQYDRAAYPCDIVGGSAGNRVRYRFLERTRGFGTSHFSRATKKALQEYMVRHVGRQWRANNVFGEGANPRLRALREAIDELGLPAEQLLRHGQTKCVYGVALASNVRDYLLRLDAKPDYLFETARQGGHCPAISKFWFERWVRPRLNTAILERVRQHSLALPIRHRARVELPEDDDGMISLFADFV